MELFCCWYFTWFCKYNYQLYKLTKYTNLLFIKIEEDKGRFSVGVTAVVRVTLKDGTFHEDVGYGTAENPKRGPAIEKAKKEAVSDARKRCLRLYGDALGNCLYDKSHLKRIKSSAGNTGDDLLDYKSISTQSVKSESVISEETSSPQTSPSHSNTTPIVKSEPKQNNTSPIKSSNSLPNTRLPLPKSAPYSKPQSGNNGKSQIPAQIKTFSPAKKLPPPAYCNQSVQNGFQQLNTASVKLQPKTTQTPNLQPHQSFDNFSDVDMAAFEAAEQSYQQYQPTQV